MKIAIFTDTFYPSINWIVTSIITSSSELAAMWHEILIITPYNKGIEDYNCVWIEIYPIKWIPAIFYPDFKITFWFTPALISKLRNFQPDVLHFHTQFIIWWQAIILGKIFWIPRVWTFHTYIADESYLKVIWLNSKVFGKLWWKYNNFFYNHVEKVLVPSKNARKELSDHWIDKNSITILSNPLPHTYNEEKEKKQFLKWVTTKNIILYVWRLSKEKNIDVCLDSVYVISKEIPNILFVIVWDWPYKKDLILKVKKLKIEKNVLFLWKLSHKDLFSSDIMERSKLFFTASPSETQWITIIEAMNFWLPIVWVNERWVWELIKENWFKAKNENYWELALYVLRLLKNEQLREKMWTLSIKESKKFDSKALAKKQLKIYEELIEK